MSTAEARLVQEGERGRIVDLAQRLRPASRRVSVIAIAAGVVALPSFGPGPLLALAGVVALFELSCTLLQRGSRPAAVIWLNWLGCIALMSAGLAAASGPRLYLFAIFAYAVVFLGILLPGRDAALATLLTVLALLGLALLLDGHAVERFPPYVLYPISTVLITALTAGLARRKDLSARRCAHLDDLTNALNRTALMARVEELRHQASTSGERREPVGVLLLDIDHFKDINDGYGHSRGDAVLAAIATRMTAALAARAQLYRLGGEEFVALCPGADREETRTLAEKLWQALRGSPVDGIEVTASIGVAVSQASGFDFDATLAAADRALYAAKNAGRDRVVLEQQLHPVGALPQGERRAATSSAFASAGGTTAAPRSAGAQARSCEDGGWILSSPEERRQLVSYAQRGQLLGLIMIYPCVFGALVVAARIYGWRMLLTPTIGAVTLFSVIAILPRVRRPERWLAAAWLFCELAAAGGWVLARPHAGDPMIVALPALTILVGAFSPAFPPRIVAAGAAIAGVLMIVVATLYSPHETASAPGILALDVAIMIMVAAIGCTAGRSTLSYLEVSVVDRLTGMLTRSALAARVGELEHAGSRAGAIGVIVCDLDQLKEVNDRHGHAAGDAVLRGAAERIREQLRTFDTVCRVGGDEFVALIPAIEENAALLAERLRSAVAAAPICDARVTLSIGVAVCRPGEAFDYSRLFAAADAALYAAKGAGRNCVRVAQSTPESPASLAA
ncbi:MAG TPA: GGDEF domain-containing protein [Solirubrobacteraceae bacterium]|nr:GGDEF domain-containing protein [Solirubrobacteraceae bacterium]